VLVYLGVLSLVGSLEEEAMGVEGENGKQVKQIQSFLVHSLVVVVVVGAAIVEGRKDRPPGRINQELSFLEFWVEVATIAGATVAVVIRATVTTMNITMATIVDTTMDIPLVPLTTITTMDTLATTIQVTIIQVTIIQVIIIQVTIIQVTIIQVTIIQATIIQATITSSQDANAEMT